MVFFLFLNAFPHWFQFCIVFGLNEYIYLGQALYLSLPHYYIQIINCIPKVLGLLHRNRDYIASIHKLTFISNFKTGWRWRFGLWKLYYSCHYNYRCWNRQVNFDNLIKFPIPWKINLCIFFSFSLVRKHSGIANASLGSSGGSSNGSAGLFTGSAHGSSSQSHNKT